MSIQYVKTLLLSKVTIAIILFAVIHNVIHGSEDFPYLIKICYVRPDALCLGTYIRPNFILVTEPCACYGDALLHRNAYLLAGTSDTGSCDSGERRKVVKPYFDKHAYNIEDIRKIGLLKINQSFPQGPYIQTIQVTLDTQNGTTSFKQRQISVCDIYGYKYGSNSIRRFPCEMAELSECRKEFGFIPHSKEMECLKIEKDINIFSSPVVCNGSVEGFVVAIKEKIAAFVTTFRQGDWISIMADGRTLKVAMSNSYCIKLNQTLFVSSIICILLRLIIHYSLPLIL